MLFSSVNRVATNLIDVIENETLIVIVFKCNSLILHFTYAITYELEINEPLGIPSHVTQTTSYQKGEPKARCTGIRRGKFFGIQQK